MWFPNDYKKVADRSWQEIYNLVIPNFIAWGFSKIEIYQVEWYLGYVQQARTLTDGGTYIKSIKLPDRKSRVLPTSDDGWGLDKLERDLIESGWTYAETIGLCRFALHLFQDPRHREFVHGEYNDWIKARLARKNKEVNK